jgi:isopenicillin-N epimerase
MTTRPPPAGDLAAHWALDPGVAFLNHGSFGACPLPVLEEQRRWRARLEREPVRFFVRDLESLLDAARAELAAFVGADAADLVFVPNATTGVNAVLRSLAFAAGDELLTTDHAYNACRNVLDFVAARAGARVVVVPIPLPIDSAQDVTERVLTHVTPRTRLALLDHVTSPTALVFPVRRLVEDLAARGVDTLVDGAHAPGMVPPGVREVGAAYYAGNCHKWLCAPKGAGFLCVRRDRHALIRPAVISHGANSPRTDRSRLLIEFDWTGTSDPTPYLCVPAAIRLMDGLLPGGWAALRQRNHALALAARRLVCEALGVPPPCPDDMVGSMAAVPLPDGAGEEATSLYGGDPLQTLLFERHRIEVPVIPWPAPPRRLVRLSAQVYNRLDEFRHLAAALRAEVGPARG